MPDHRSADKVAVTIYVPRDLKDDVRDEAQARGETVTAFINRACRSYTRERRKAKETAA